MPKVPGIRNPRSDNTAPTVPTNLVATTLSTTSISLTWTASTDAGVGVAGYQVWRDYAPIAVRTVTNYTDSGLEPSTPYEYHVSAYDANGNMSGLSLPSSATTDDAGDNADPVWQTIAQQELTTGTNFSLPLGSFVTDPEGLAITIAQVSGTLPTGVTLNTSTKIVSGTPTVVLASSSVVFRATDLEGAFADKTVVFNCLAPDTTAPSVPTNLAGTAFSRQRIDLTWTASTDTAGTNERSSGLSGYKLYRDGALRATLGLVTSYSDTGLATGTTYSYRLSAFDVALNESAQCTAVPVATAANSEPEWVTPAALGTFGHPLTSDLTIRLLASDDDGDPITYTYDSPLPTGWTITDLTSPLGALLTVPAGSAAGDDITFTAYASDIGSPGEAEQDWLYRTQTGPYAAGVVWAHDFRYPEEFTQFYATPYGAAGVSSSTTGGFGNGGYLEYRIPKGIPDGSHYIYADSTTGWLVVDGTALPQPAYGASNADWTWQSSGSQNVIKGGWLRPLAALQAVHNGLPTADPAATDTVTRRSYTGGASVANRQYNFRTGLYGHSSYHSTPFTSSDGLTNVTAADWDGTDFYLQFRVRVSASRFGFQGLPATTDGAIYQQRRVPSGKLTMLVHTAVTPLNEIIITSNPTDPRTGETTSPFQMYTNQSAPAVQLRRARSPAGQWIQPGGAYDTSCYWDGSSNSIHTCWEWPGGEWVTVLMHVIPGRDNTGFGNGSETNLEGGTYPYHDTGLEVWVARQSQLANGYVKVFDWRESSPGANNGMGFNYDSDGVFPPSWTAISPSGYMNNFPSIVEFTQQFTQIIFSKSPIPCPQV
jgi:hypothetical protein